MDRAAVAVVGGGAWGLALAAAAARTGQPTFMHSRRVSNGSLPTGVTHVLKFAEVGERARLVILAVPSHVVRGVLRELGDQLDGRHLVVHGIRGFVGEAAHLERIGEVVRAETPVRRIGALGGPALADDLTAGRPSVLVVGSHFPEVNAAVVCSLGGESLRIYSTDDLIGLEWASAVVGCLAVGVGYAQAVGLSAGLLAGVISRAVQEGAKLAAAAGGDERTLLGLAGNGDLLACAGQPDRPEVAVGAALGRGASLEEAVKTAKHRVEAVELIPRIASWAEKRGVSAPIFSALAHGVLASKPTKEIVRELMTGPIEDRG
jgi:glycerol-3-phosphate dehydrogenase (NAD(P)+)